MPATLPDLTNADTWTDDDLDALRVAVRIEQERRYVLATAPDRAEQTARQYRDAVEAALADLPSPEPAVSASHVALDVDGTPFFSPGSTSPQPGVDADGTPYLIGA